MGKRSETMEFVVDNLEVIVMIVGGAFFGSIMFITKAKSGENDLTQTYIKHKKYSDGINKSSKTMF